MVPSLASSRVHGYSNAMRYPLPILVLPLLVACSSATKAIHADAATIRGHAQDTIILAEALPPDVGKPIIVRQEKIVDLSSNIQENTTRVKNITPWWASLLGRVAMAAVAVAVLLILWQTGVGYIIRRILMSIGLFIPKPQRRHVSEVYDLREGERTIDEIVEERRLTDPAFEAAYRKEGRRRRRKNSREK